MRIHHATLAKAKKFGITLTIEENEVVATGKAGVRLASGLQGNKVLEDAITKATGHAPKGVKFASAAKFGAVVGDLQKTPAPKGVKTLSKLDKMASVKPTKEVDPYEEAAKEDGWKKTRWGFSKEGEESVSKDQADSWQGLCELHGLEVETGEDDEEEGGQSKSVVKAKYKARYKPTKNRCGDELSHRMNEHCSREDDEDGVMKINLDALRKFAKANECWVESYASLKSRVGTFNGGMAMMNTNNRLRAKLRKIEKTEGRPFDIDKDIVWK